MSKLSKKVTVFEKAQKAMKNVENALSLFTHLVTELTTSKEKLQAVVAEADQVIKDHTDLKETAQGSIKEYQAMIENIEKLVGGKKQ